MIEMGGERGSGRSVLAVRHDDDDDDDECELISAFLCEHVHVFALNTE